LIHYAFFFVVFTIHLLFIYLNGISCKRDVFVKLTNACF
jgi:hypothetical protein